MEPPSVMQIVGRSFSVWGRRFVFFSTVTVLTGTPDLVLRLAVSRPSLFRPMDWLTWLDLSLQLLGDALASGVITFAVVGSLRGSDSRATTALAAGLRRWPALVGLVVAATIAISGGAILLLVPGLILLCMCFVAIPALMFENEGIFAALGRSATLTKGARWRILGIVGVLLIVQVLGYGVVHFTPLHDQAGAKVLEWAMDGAISILESIASGLLYERLSRAGTAPAIEPAAMA